MAIKSEKATTEVVGKAVTEAVENASKTDTDVVEPTQQIYIGPNTPQLTTYTVVQGKFPIHIEALIKKCPSIRNLFVPITKLTTLEPKTKTKGTIEYRHFQNVLEFMAKKERD